MILEGGSSKRRPRGPGLRPKGYPRPEASLFLLRPEARGLRPVGASPLGDADLGADFLELLLDRFGLVLRHAFLDRLGRALDEILGFLQPQAGDFADDLDDLDLVRAGFGQRDVELGLLFRRRRRCTAARTAGHRHAHRHRRRGGDAELGFQLLHQLRELEDADVLDVVDELILRNFGHDFFSLSFAGGSLLPPNCPQPRRSRRESKVTKISLVVVLLRGLRSLRGLRDSVSTIGGGLMPRPLLPSSSPPATAPSPDRAALRTAPSRAAASAPAAGRAACCTTPPCPAGWRGPSLPPA